MKEDLILPFYVKVSIIIIGLLAFVTILYLTQSIIVPIIYSTIIAIVLNPMVVFFTKRNVNEAVAISITLIIGIVTTLLIISLLSMQMMQFTDSFPKLVEKFNQFADSIELWASDRFGVDKLKIHSMILRKRSEFINNGGVLIGETLLSTGSKLIVALLIPVYVFMILWYQKHLVKFIHKLFNRKEYGEVDEVLSSTKLIIQGYLDGLFLEALIMAFLNSITLLIIGVDYAILLGVLGAIVNVVPYIGGIISIFFPVIIAIGSNTPSDAVWVVISYLVIQFFDVHYIVPKVVASKVKINALISIIVVLAGGALWGFPGMFISIPLTAIIKVIFDHVEQVKPWGFLLGVPPTEAPLVTPKQDNKSSKSIFSLIKGNCKNKSTV
jgi:predicted PurR-regulated permease PerM